MGPQFMQDCNDGIICPEFKLPSFSREIGQEKIKFIDTWKVTIKTSRPIVNKH